MFNIQYEDENNQMVPVWQNSWGLTTRSIGILIMVHGDDKGLVLPPRVAPIQVVIIPIVFKTLSQEVSNQLNEFSKSIHDLLLKNEIRTQLDDRSQYSPGFKFNHWELKGIPIRIEIGPKDLETKSVVVVRRDNSSKTQIPFISLLKFLNQQFEEMQSNLLEKAKKKRDERISKVKDWSDFMLSLDKGNLCLSPWCLEENCEEIIKQKSAECSKDREKDEQIGFGLSGSAKSLCIPFDQHLIVDENHNNFKCFACGKDAKKWTLFGRSY